MKSEYSNLDKPSRRRIRGDGTPALVIIRPSSTQDRLIIDINLVRRKCGCSCGEFNPIAEADIEILPEALQGRGITQHEWETHMRRLNNTLRKETMNVWTQVALLMLLVTIPVFFVRLNRLQRKVRAVISDFNDQVLEKRGLYAKTQKSVFHFGRYHEEAPWLAIALNKDESLELQREEHVFLYNPTNRSHTPNDGCCKCSNSCCGTVQVI